MNICVHHIAFDGWSAATLHRQLSTLYREALSEQSDGANRAVVVRIALPALQYRHFAAWQNRMLHSPVVGKQIEYWKEKLADVEPPPRLACESRRIDPPVNASPSARSDALLERRILGDRLARQLTQMAARHRATPFMVLSAAFMTLLYRYTGQRDIAIGTISAYRVRQEFEAIIGCFVNPLVLRQIVDPDLRFSELLAQMRATALAAFDHQDVPFDKLVESLNARRDGGEHPFFRYLFIYQNMSEQALSFDGVNLQATMPAAQQTAQELTLWLQPVGEELRITALFDPLHISPSTTRRLFDHFERLLLAILNDAHVRIKDLDYMGDQERATLLQRFSGASQLPGTVALNRADTVMGPRAIVARFDTVVIRQPDHTALFATDHPISYRQLQQQSNAISDSLIQHG